MQTDDSEFAELSNSNPDERDKTKSGFLGARRGHLLFGCLMALVLAFAYSYELRKRSLPEWQRELDFELSLGRVDHVISNQCLERIFFEYRRLRENDCREKIRFFKYLTLEYLVRVDGDAHGRESVAEMIAKDSCVEQYKDQISSMMNESRVSKTEKRKVQAWVEAISRMSTERD